MNKSEFIKMILSNVKTKKWLNGTFEVIGDNGVSYLVGVKAYGLWVQVLTVNGLSYSGTMYNKTQKALKLELEQMLKGI